MSGALLLTVAPTEPAFEIGEPVWVEVHVENRGKETVFTALPNSLVSRSEELFATVLDPRGDKCPDPFRFPRQSWADNSTTILDIAPGASETLRIDLTKYAWFDEPGTYHVRLLAPLHVRWNETPSVDDPRWVETDVLLATPRDPDALVEALPKRTMDALPRGGPWPNTWRMDANTYAGLGHALYVPILEPLAAQSLPTEVFDRGSHGPDRKDERALYGLGGCPCTEATEALFRLYDRFFDPALREIIMRELELRIPGDRWHNSWFTERAWDHERFDALALDRARAALRGSTSVRGWGSSYVWGAKVIAWLGDASDGQLVAEAIERALAGDRTKADVTNQVDGVLDYLYDAQRAHPAGSNTARSPDAQLFEDLTTRWDGRTGEPPPGWEALVIRALGHPNPSIVLEGMHRLPYPMTPALLEAILPHMGSPSILIKGAIDRYWLRHPPDDAVVRGPLLRELSSSRDPTRTLALLMAIKPYLPMDEFVELFLTELEEAPTTLEIDPLSDVFTYEACREFSSGGTLAPGGAEDLARAWRAELAAHPTTYDHVGQVEIVPGVTNPDLFPPTFYCKRPSGEWWPRERPGPPQRVPQPR